jgi:hypothetical protein
LGGNSWAGYLTAGICNWRGCFNSNQSRSIPASNELEKKAANVLDHQGLYAGKVALLFKVLATEPQPEHPQPQEKFFGWISVFHIRFAIKKTATAIAINTRSCCIFFSKG